MLFAIRAAFVKLGSLGEAAKCFLELRVPTRLQLTVHQQGQILLSSLPLKMAASQMASASSFKNPKLISIPDVEIDKSGKFKYVLIKVHDPDMDREFKHIVRGTAKAAYHADIYDSVAGQIEEKGLDCEVLGGGRIEHEPAKKSIKIYGYSQQFGQADHSIAHSLLLRKFKDYDHITWSNEGY